MRVLLTIQLVWLSYKQLVRENVLPWLLCSFGIIVLSQGQTAQPTSLGFFALVGGLLLAALKVPRVTKAEAPLEKKEK
jgi:hypothetical protein